MCWSVWRWWYFLLCNNMHTMFTHTPEKFRSCLEREGRQIDKLDHRNYLNILKDISSIVKNNFQGFFFSWHTLPILSCFFKIFNTSDRDNSFEGWTIDQWVIFICIDSSVVDIFLLNLHVFFVVLFNFFLYIFILVYPVINSSYQVLSDTVFVFSFCDVLWKLQKYLAI